jgi:iron complex outermembrane receptor protein
MKMKTYAIGAATASVTLLVGNAFSRETSSNPVVDLDPLVVTSTRSTEATRVSFDPRIAIQPLPANDGADALRHVTGFNVIRKGGTDGDPTFRSMAGSRLPVVLDGVCTLGGCGNRMDPPTAYVFPSSFDKVTILKGPQSVLYGPGASAGAILFERNAPRFSEPSASLKSYLNLSSYDRRDLSVEGLVGNANTYARLQGSWSEAGDYEDGDGKVSNSSYERWNTQTALGWTPTDSSALEFSVSLSNGEAAYADRGMDGTQFDRSAYSLRYRADQLEGAFRSVDAQVYHSYVDHVMDNFSLREFTPSMMMPMPMLSNPDRLTTGASLKLELDPVNGLESTLGIDRQSNRHRARNAMGAATARYENLPFLEDGNFDQLGLFGEFRYSISERQDLAFGLRLDHWEAEDLRSQVRVGMMGGLMANPTANAERSDTLASGFFRLEREIDSRGSKLYAGLGHSERYPDYWEIFSKESANSLSAFNTDTEKVTQLDLGTLTQHGDFSFNASLFYAKHNDYILIESGYAKPMGMMNRSATISRNIDATTFGGELELSYQNDQGWYTGSALAYTRGTNDTDHGPLGQIAPLEFKLEGGLRRENWSAGWIARFVDEQDRFALNQGNIVGQDIGPSDSFSVYSLHSSYRFNESWSLAAGIDNLFDETYAEHLSRAGTMVSGYIQTTRVNELGRAFWARLSAKF